MLEKLRLKIKQENGISLIELAIGLVILGLIVTPLMHSYKDKIRSDSMKETRGALANITKSINQYYLSGSGAYPCPASLILRENTANFGKVGDCTLANIKMCNDPLWRTNEGICKTSNGTDAVIIGAVPFSSLKMQQEASLDYWGNKIIYAVTFEQTDNATFTANAGAISVDAVDRPGEVQSGAADGIPEEKTDVVDFFLFSTGISGLGGFTKDGIALSDCGAIADGYESENCDFDNKFFYDVDPAFNDPFDDAASAFSEIAGVTFFDDITRAQSSVPEATWFQHPDNVLYADDVIMTFANRIGIGTEDPKQTIDVVGDTRIEGGLKSKDISNIDNTVGFDPELITGTKDVMKCDSAGVFYGEQAVMRLYNSKVSCSSSTDNTGNAINGEKIKVDTDIIKIKSCGGGELASGIDADGYIKCIEM